MNQEPSHVALQRQLYLEARCMVEDLQRQCQRLQKLNKVLRSETQMYERALRDRDDQIEGYHMERQGLKCENEWLKEQLRLNLLHSCSADVVESALGTGNNKKDDNKKDITTASVSTDETVATSSDSEPKEDASLGTFDSSMNTLNILSPSSSIAIGRKSHRRNRRRTRYPKIHESEFADEDSDQTSFFNLKSHQGHPRGQIPPFIVSESVINSTSKSSTCTCTSRTSPQVGTRSTIGDNSHDPKEADSNTTSSALDKGDTALDEMEVQSTSSTSTSTSTSSNSHYCSAPQPTLSTTKSSHKSTITKKTGTTRNTTLMATSSTGRILLIPRGLTDNIVSFHFDRKYTT